MFKNKKRNKTFKTNEEYFAWFDKTKEEIEIVEFKITDDKIKISYEEIIKEIREYFNYYDDVGVNNE